MRPRTCPPCLPRAALVALLLLHLPLAHADDASEVRELISRGQLDAALLRAEKAAAEHPRDAQLRFLQGVVLMDLNRDADALALFTQMAQEYPELPDPYNNIALLHARAGRLEEAERALQTALRNNPGYRTALANLGLVHMMLAVQSWQLAAASGPPDSTLQRRLGAARAILAREAAN